MTSGTSVSELVKLPGRVDADSNPDRRIIGDLIFSRVFSLRFCVRNVVLDINVRASEKATEAT